MNRLSRLSLAGFVLAGCLLALAVVLVFAGPARASELKWSDPRGYVVPPRVPPVYDFMSVGLEVLVDGRPVSTVSHHGRTYLPVPWIGAEYQIRVWNSGPRRVTALVSVDGLSVLSGRPASDTDPGYVVAAHDSVVIPGWRRDLDRVAAFQFVDRRHSYAARMGYPENIGMIGLLAIEEASPLRPLLEQPYGMPSPKAAEARSGGVGSGYGRDLDSHAYRVSFVRGPNRRSQTIYYDTPEALRRIGVPVGGPVPDEGDYEFVPPPPPYRDR
jgi:hypothetical protein